MQFSYRWAAEADRNVVARTPVTQVALDPGPGPALRLEVRAMGDTRLYVRLISEGLPAPGNERPAAQGLAVAVRYQLAGGGAAGDSFEQGQDIESEVEVRNPGKAPYEQLALTQLVPAGWEIRPAQPEAEAPGAAPAAAPAQASRAQPPRAQAAAQPGYDYQDIRDDRVLTYFGLKAGETKVFRVRLNAAYQGTFYLPLTKVEAMYDPTVSARTAGRWIRVVPPAP